MARKAQTVTVSKMASEPAPAAEGEVYTQFQREAAAAGYGLTTVSTSDFTGLALPCQDLQPIRGHFTMPLSLTVVEGSYFAHPVLRVRSLD